MKLALGTAQLGMDYGISNTQGQPDFDVAKRILQAASTSGIDLIDTAAAYGNSESVIGQCHDSEIPALVMTKLYPGSDTEDKVLTSCTQSLMALNEAAYCYSVLFHNSHDMNEQTYKTMKGLQEDGKFKKLGVSVYAPEELDHVLAHFDVDLIQLPLNLFDQRFLHTNQIQRMKEKGIEVHARSLFLQGLLLMPPEQRPQFTHEFSEYFSVLDAVHEQTHLHHLTLCLTLLHQVNEIDRFIVGINSVSELEQILTHYKLAKEIKVNLGLFRCDELHLITPSLWPEE
ncbi:aldo/keto reductase [Algicola sagamiensis]|uniref:aldo/keto reductase n=1 Tax=Algicola sagamiensis TaxID=163869 RepID=UPI000364B251|nr:aldo/keto reductase [Algicola sagamiensis]